MWFRNIAGLIFAFILIFGFQNCSPNHDQLSSNDQSLSLGSVESLSAFEQTLYPILQANCAECHGANQSPQFAVSNPLASHDAVINSGLVNFLSPGSSRLVQKVIEGHQNFPFSLSTELETAIIAWADQVESSGPGGGALPVPPVLEPTFKSIYALILNPKCESCHSAGGERPQENYSTYALTMRTVKPGNANDSEMYKECRDGDMPENAPNLSEEELAVMREWINSGALDN